MFINIGKPVEARFARDNRANAQDWHTRGGEGQRHGTVK
jgi:hypothetical protein